MEKDTFGRDAVLSILKTQYLGKETVFFDETDSTNTEVKRRADHAAEGLLVIADVQNKGKGRRGRSWENPGGVNIAMSLLLKPDVSPDTAPMLTIVMALASAEGIRKVTGLNPLIKWPNDIVFNGKKCAGILTEMALQEDRIKYVIIGTGINVNNTGFPEELSNTATSLLLESGQKQSRAFITAEIINSFEKYYDIFMKTGTLCELSGIYNDICVNSGKRVCVLDPKGAFEADAIGINDKGELIVHTDDGGELSIYAGEVSVRGVYGYT